jgi:hypothetical protein
MKPHTAYCRAPCRHMKPHTAYSREPCPSAVAMLGLGGNGIQPTTPAAGSASLRHHGRPAQSRPTHATRLQLACNSPATRLQLACNSPATRLQLPATRLQLACNSPATRLQLACNSPSEGPGGAAAAHTVTAAGTASSPLCCQLAWLIINKALSSPRIRRIPSAMATPSALKRPQLVLVLHECTRWCCTGCFLVAPGYVWHGNARPGSMSRGTVARQVHSYSESSPLAA